MKRPVVLLTGPRRSAVSGVSTHVNLLLDSRLTEAYGLVHFEVGREGRSEGALSRVGRLLASPFQLARAVLRHHAAIVHLNTDLTLRAYWRDLAYMIVARLCNARVLYQVHGGALPEDFCGGHRVSAGFLRATLGLADLIVVLSESEHEAFRRFGVAPRVVVMPNCIDCGLYAGLRRAPTPPERPLRLLYLGRLVREKGLFELIEALQIARSESVAAELILAGDGPAEVGLRRAVASLELPQVSFAGAVRGPDKMRLLQWADVLVLPSYAEGLPYALLEGMAAGLPAIATGVGAVPEVVADGVNGLLVEPRSPAALAGAVRTLAGNRVGLARMCEASRATIIAGHSIGRLVAQLRCVYAVLCARQADRHVART